MNPSPRIVILSDTHMAKPGRGAGSAAALRPLWQGATRVIFNGDTAETRSQRFYDESTRRIEELRRLTAEDGVELTLIAGNHDPLISEIDWVELFDGRVVITHGDLLHPAVAPWSDENNELENEYRQAMREMKETPDSADARDKSRAAKRASARYWRKQGLDRYYNESRGLWRKWLTRARKASLVLYYWVAMPRRARRFARGHFPDCRFFIFGHIHRPGVWRWPTEDGIGELVVLNTGAYRTPRWPRAVVIENGQIGLYKVRFSRKNGHRLADRPQHAFKLCPPVSRNSRTRPEKFYRPGQ